MAPINPTEFDVIVIGSGSGSKITRPAAKLGNKVAIVEKGPLGGTCLNRGCIPSKMLIHPADVINEIEHAKTYDITVPAVNDVTIDKAKLVNYVTSYVDGESASIDPIYEKDPNVTHIKKECAFVDDHTLRIRKTEGVNSDDDTYITGKKIFVVAGARPIIPRIPGLEGTPYMTSTEVLRCPKTFKRVIIIGGGYIATELGYYLGKTGSEVTFLVRSGFVKNEDIQVQEEFTKIFSQMFDCHFKVQFTKVEYNNEIFKVYVNENGEDKVYEAEGLFVATGVTPNTDVLEVKNAGIELDKRGYIKVDEYLRTNVPHIWSWGDIIGRNLFRHSANFEGEYAFRTIFEETPKGIEIKPIDYPPVPHAIFTNPQIGGVGLTEQEAKAKGIDYVIGLCPYKNSAMGDALRSKDGFVKLIFERSTRKLIGAHIIGVEASNMIHMCIAFLQFGATIDDMLRTIYIHPALPELVRNAARRALPNF
ncbi:mercuric reductase [Piromyces finnis]|uniref:Mercuric reductase n=1 Tax=Piromyces finnis TaxID=1754191 RepID=A0A1Y1VGV0_9FUNG|nr:mercuric reductase [Piromyces finnis]|eukprot:ORX55957.1 mercuric reductase [Piromyces finnis]